jgi:hypothetical protein
MSASELPDLADGLTAAERLVVNRLTSSFHRSDRIVDGDRALYATLVRMVQRFSTRYPLVEGEGNFGNIDGWPAADMEYTEVRRSQIAADVTCFPTVLVNGGPGIPPTISERSSRRPSRTLTIQRSTSPTCWHISPVPTSRPEG